MFAQDKYGAWEQGSERKTTDTDRERGTEVRWGNINQELMVQLKAHLYNRWPWLNILSLPIESDRVDNDPSPPTALLNRPERALLVAELWYTGFTAHTYTSSQHSSKENQAFWPHKTHWKFIKHALRIVCNHIYWPLTLNLILTLGDH